MLFYDLISWENIEEVNFRSFQVLLLIIYFFMEWDWANYNWVPLGLFFFFNVSRSVVHSIQSLISLSCLN